MLEVANVNFLHPEMLVYLYHRIKCVRNFRVNIITGVSHIYTSVSLIPYRPLSSPTRVRHHNILMTTSYASQQGSLQSSPEYSPLKNGPIQISHRNNWQNDTDNDVWVLLIKRKGGNVLDFPVL